MDLPDGLSNGGEAGSEGQSGVKQYAHLELSLAKLIFCNYKIFDQNRAQLDLRGTLKPSTA